jgi:ribosomal-protein-alanine N-acetyltransferase
LNIRLATSADVPAIIAIEQQCVSAAHWTENQYRELFKHAMTKELSQRLVLAVEEISPASASPTLDGRALLGFLIARNIDREWELENIAVSPTARRRGLAILLVEEFLRHAGETSGETVFLEVRESNQSARALYLKSGFSESGRRKAYYQAPAEDAIVYHRRLL